MMFHVVFPINEDILCLAGLLADYSLSRAQLIILSDVGRIL
jgi:hypothetical protein